LGTDRWRYQMSELEVIDTPAFDRIKDVAELHLQSKSPYQISRALGIKVGEALEAIRQWQEIINNDMASRDAARDFLNTMVQRYEVLISEANDNLENIKSLEFNDKNANQINATLRLIADLDAKRVDLLQKAGLLDAADLGDELAMREEREAAVLDILRNDLCDHCQPVVRAKLTRLTGTVEGTVVEQE
jgi:hypothetical protein